MFDISSLATTETTFMQFRNARDELVFNEGKPVGVTFHSPGSAAYQAILDQQQQELIDEGERLGSRAKLTAKKLRERQDALLAGATISFDGFAFEADGKKGSDLFLALWSDPKYMLVREQANSWLGNAKNFLIGSATS